MTNEEKQLLLKDLCCRLPYKVKIEANVCPRALFPMDVVAENLPKPYLRPMSSMTDKEKDYVIHLADLPCAAQICEKKVDFFLSHHIDWRGLLPKGLALEAPEGMYEIN